MMERGDRNKLRENLPLLTRDMDFDVVTTHLMSKMIFDKHHIENFQSKPNTMLRNRDLLLKLETRGPKAFQALIEALVGDGDPAQIFLAQKLGYRAPDEGADADTGTDTGGGDGDPTRTKSPSQSFEEGAVSSSDVYGSSSLDPTGMTEFSQESQSSEMADGPLTDDDASDAFPLHMTNKTTAYSMTSKPRGIVILMNNKRFQTLSSRPKAITDFTLLWETFQDLGFNIIVYDNRKSKDMRRILKKHAQQSHSRFDCLFVVVLSYGREGHVYGTDEKLISIEDIISPFHQDQCPTLQGKPKIFFIHAPFAEESPGGGVDGGDRDDTYGMHRTGDPKAEQHGLSSKPEPFDDGALSALITRTRDVLLYYSHLSGKQNSEMGTLFIKSLTDTIKKEARHLDLQSMVFMAHDQMEGAIGSSQFLPSPLNSLRKNVFFLPGYYRSKPGKSVTLAEGTSLPQDLALGQASPADLSKTDDSSAYKMESKPRGKAIIINNEKFENMPMRSGTAVDCKTLTDLFKWLYFEVDVRENLTEKKTRELIDKCMAMDHSKYDCFILAILTHGENGFIYSVDGKRIAIEEITTAFGSDRCPSLAKKPKVFFLQACRGDKKDPGIEMVDSQRIPAEAGKASSDRLMTGEEEEEEEEELVERLLDLDLMDLTDGACISKLPTLSDMLLAYATIPGYVSWRNSKQGSWFIQAVNKVFRECAKEQDLVSMTTCINREVATMYESSTGRHKMMPAPVNMLTKKLYFFPEK